MNNKNCLIIEGKIYTEDKINYYAQNACVLAK